MRVLVACEFSGIVRDAFLKRGHDAYSCDLLETEVPGPHLKGDVREFLESGWDLMIAHPPCRYLAVSGACWMSDPARIKEQEKALEFVKDLLLAPVPRIALENPVSVISTKIRPPDQYIQPYQYGHPESKKTGLWLKNLPLLIPENIVESKGTYVAHKLWGSDPEKRRRERSRTYLGIAEAMANQWSDLSDVPTQTVLPL